MEEHRPLKRAKLGMPDVYPQEIRQREDELTVQTVTQGLRLPSAHSYETGSARMEIQHLRTADFVARLNSISDIKRRTAWGQDNQKKRMNLSRDNFWPVPVGRSKKEQAALWFQSLAADSESLEQLVKRKVPIFNKREDIFEVLFEKDVPTARAVWYIKLTAAHLSLSAEMKLTKKKQASDPSFEWTVSLTKFMQETVWRISNEARHDSVSSTKGQYQSAFNDETVMELSRWKYITELSSWLYQENLLDRHEFLRWLIERIETSKVDEKSLILYLPLALKYLIDISKCVYLARPLVLFCCQKFSSAYDIHQKYIKSKEASADSVETNMEDDDVFSSATPISVKVKQEIKKGHHHGDEGSPRQFAGRKRNKSGSLTVTIEDSNVNNPPLASPTTNNNDKSCHHHNSLLLQLSCIIQMVAIHCPMSFINVTLTGKVVKDNVSKATTPLDKLPLKLLEMPLPKKVAGMDKKLESALVTAEHEIRQRTKAAETGWSTMAIADLQISNKSHIVPQILKMLKVLDKHSFATSKSHSTLSTLYIKLTQANKPNEFSPQIKDAFCMLLCQWAVTPHRHGYYRSLVAARLLKRLQVDTINGCGQLVTDLIILDEFWENPDSTGGVMGGVMGGVNEGRNDMTSFPFQQTLFKFLDTHAPLPESLYFPLKDNSPFKHLMTLFSELIDLHVFSYTLYLSTLIARGATLTPIIPALPFFRGEGYHPPVSPMELDPLPEGLNLTIPLSLLPKYENMLLSKKPSTLDIKVERDDEGTISPRLSSAFGSQTNLLATLGDYSSAPFGHEIKMEENPSLLQMRADKLERLAMLDEEGPSQLVSPVGFGSHASSPMKPDVFNFSLNFLNESPDQSLEETLVEGVNSRVSMTTTNMATKLDMKSNKLLIYAAYFPVHPLDMSPQSRSQRSAVLCGTGHLRSKVDEIIKKLQEQGETLLKELSNQESPILSGSATDYIKEFQLLPTFEQHYIACNNAQSILTQNKFGSRLFPSCSQLVFVCELLRISGSYSQIIQLIVELLTCEEDKKEGRSTTVYTPLPQSLCVPVVNNLWIFHPVLLLSLHDTLVVYERLYKLIDCSMKPSKFTSSQKIVFLYLKHMQSHCHYIERTFSILPNYFDGYCVPRVEDMSCQTGILHVPTLLRACLDSSVYVGGRQADSELAISQMVTFMCTTSKNSFFFVCEVFKLVLQKQTPLLYLAALAYISAEISGPIDLLPKEFLGAVRALCIPNTIYKACETGYTQLTQKSNVLASPGIHGNFVTFIGLLLAFNCFTIHDIITYIVKPIFKVYLLHPQQSVNAHQGTLSLQFVSLLLRHLLVDSYIQGQHVDKEESCGIIYPPFVRHFLLAKSQELSFDSVLNLLKDLLKLCKDTLRSSRGTTLGGKTGMSIFVESFPSGSQGNEAALIKLRETMELIAEQDWVREQCSKQDSRQLLDPDKLGDASLSPSQAQYLLHLLIPYCPQDTVNRVSEPDGSLPSFMTHSEQTVQRILKNLDQWTLHNALLHLDLNINQALLVHSTSQVEHLAQSVIQVFEDSCTDEWSDDTSACVDGAYCPSIWLVTPLVSELPKAVLGRILKCAGNVLGKGQWWNPDRLQERRRSTRTTNTPTTPHSKSGLQWQQPFLELVLACMNSHHSNHDELLCPLQKQLTTFLTAFEKDGFPPDEQNKSMLYTALRLRLGLVGSMLPSVCSVSENNILEWVSLLIQLICSGAVDRQPDNSELFTNCLDMLSALLQALSPDYHMCVVCGGEEGKKSYINCIKKMKSDLSNSRSCCKQEIQQLFPLPQKPFEVTVVKPPSAISQQFRTPEKVQGLRIQETKEISPWEIIEGIKNSGPFQLSWFGALRMKRKVHKYAEQTKLLQHHTHQNVLPSGGLNGRHFVFLPEMSFDPALNSTEPHPSTSAPSEGMDATQMAGNTPDERKKQANIEILRNIQSWNNSTSVSSQPRLLPPPFHSNTTIPNPVNSQHPLQVPQRPPGAGMVPGGGHNMMGANAGAPMMNHRPMLVRQNYEMMLRDLTQEQRNHFASLPAEDKKAYVIRRLEQRRMMEQQQMMGGYRHPMHSRPLQVAPPVQMTHVLQQQRGMMHRYGGMQGHMPPPSHHPYMIPPGHHPPMYRQQHMYGGPPRQPVHYPPPH